MRFGCFTVDVGAADDLPGPAGLFRPDPGVIHRASGVRVRVPLKDLAGDLDHVSAPGE